MPRIDADPEPEPTEDTAPWWLALYPDEMHRWLERLVPATY